MILQISLLQLSEIIDSSIANFSEATLKTLATGITTDTRTLAPGDVFLALRGDNFDGHNFIETAIEKGAIAVIVDRFISVNSLPQIPQFQVKNTLEAYQKLARWWRDRFQIPIIGVTGSVGKTTTKELISAVLSTTGKIHKTQANYNNEIGVPKTLLQITPEHDYAVIEMAMRASGEIALLTQIARPTIGIITNVGTAHIGRLGSEEAIAQAKCELLAEMPDTSIAILNHDNPLLRETAAKIWRGETITYGLEGGDLQGKIVDSQILNVEGTNFPLPLPGRHNALNYLGALAIAKVLGVDWQPLTQGLTVTLPGGRSRRYNLPNDLIVLDETYNAGLESMLAALHLLKETPGKRHIAILGTMKELGERSPQFHFQVGAKVKQLEFDRLFVLIDDLETEEIAKGASGILTECFRDRNALIERLNEIIEKGDRLLFKASNSVGLSRVVEQFCTQRSL
jgi:UDP-N-acetylmuramoyl-tripeptide--D-alanyl-D-alanine ligase